MMQQGSTMSMPLKLAFHFNVNKESLKLELMHINVEYQLFL